MAADAPYRSARSQRAKAQLKAGLLMSLESCSARAEQMARQLLVAGRLVPVEEIIEPHRRRRRRESPRRSWSDTHRRRRRRPSRSSVPASARVVLPRSRARSAAVPRERDRAVDELGAAAMAFLRSGLISDSATVHRRDAACILRPPAMSDYGAWAELRAAQPRPSDAMGAAMDRATSCRARPFAAACATTIAR